MTMCLQDSLASGLEGAMGDKGVTRGDKGVTRGDKG